MGQIHDKNDREELKLVPYEKLPGFYLHPELQIALNREGVVYNTRTNNYLSPIYEKNGRTRISIKCYKDGKYVSTEHRLHRLIGRVFVPRPRIHCDKLFQTLDINHIDTNPANNSPDNLEWCTKKENHEDTIEHEYHNSAIVIFSKNIKTNEVKKHKSITAASKELILPLKKLSKFIKDKKHLEAVFGNYMFSLNERYFPRLTYEILNPKSGNYNCAVKDLITNQVSIFENVKEASKFTGINKNIIKNNINKYKEYKNDKILIMKNTDYLLKFGVGLKTN